jgi:hypothetical protein
MAKYEANMTNNGFKDLFYDNLSKSGDFKEAYYMSEDEHQKLYDKQKYSSVDSFRVCLSKKKK